MPNDVFCVAIERIAMFLRMENLGLVSFDLRVFGFCETKLDQFISTGSIKKLKRQSSFFSPIHSLQIDDSVPDRVFNTGGVIAGAIRKAQSLRQVRIQSAGEFFRSVPGYFLADLAAAPPSHLEYLEIIAVDALCGFRPDNDSAVWCPLRNRLFLESFYDHLGYACPTVQNEFHEICRLNSMEKYLSVWRTGSISTLPACDSESESLSHREVIIRHVCANDLTKIEFPASSSFVVLNFDGRNRAVPMINNEHKMYEVVRSHAVLQSVECFLRRKTLSSFVFSLQCVDQNVVDYLTELVHIIAEDSAIEGRRGLVNLDLSEMKDDKYEGKSVLLRLVEAGIGKSKSLKSLVLKGGLCLYSWRKKYARATDNVSNAVRELEALGKHLGQSAVERICLSEAFLTDTDIIEFARGLIADIECHQHRPRQAGEK